MFWFKKMMENTKNFSSQGRNKKKKRKEKKERKKKKYSLLIEDLCLKSHDAPQHCESDLLRPGRTGWLNRVIGF
jgi:hypothetical protein